MAIAQRRLTNCARAIGVQLFVKLSKGNLVSFQFCRWQPCRGLPVRPLETVKAMHHAELYCVHYVIPHGTVGVENEGARRDVSDDVTPLVTLGVRCGQGHLRCLPPPHAVVSFFIGVKREVVEERRPTAQFGAQALAQHPRFCEQRAPGNVTQSQECLLFFVKDFPNPIDVVVVVLAGKVNMRSNREH